MFLFAHHTVQHTLQMHDIALAGIFVAMIMATIVLIKKGRL
jgi:hypothetical protein